MMKFSQAKQYLDSPLKMRPERIGDFGIQLIERPPGYKEVVVGMRTALMSGVPQASLIHEQGITRHELVAFHQRDDGTEGYDRLMSDIAQEMVDFAEPIHRMKRMASTRILIGGLGLGLIAHWAIKFGHRVTVVEIQPEIIELTGKYLPGVEIVRGDFLEYLKNLDVRREKFGFGFFDTWSGQNEMTYFSTVLPQRRAWIKAGGNPKKLWAWKETDEMLPQIHRSAFANRDWIRGKMTFNGSFGDLARTLKVAPEEQEKITAKLAAMNDNGPHPVSSVWSPYRILFEGVAEYKQRPFLDLDECEQDALIRLYVYGLLERPHAAVWERIWGARWDNAIKQEQEETDEHDNG